MSKVEKSAASPIQELAAIVDLWTWWLKDEYSLDVRVEDAAAGGPITQHYVFGPCRRREAGPSERFHFDADAAGLVSALRNGQPLPSCAHPPRAASLQVVLFSRDLIYLASLDASGPRLVIHFELRSAAFGKGRIPRYVSGTRVGRKWILRRGHPEVESLQGFEGTMEECLREIFLAAGASPHPYQSYIDANPEAYREALAREPQVP